MLDNHQKKKRKVVMPPLPLSHRLCLNVQEAINLAIEIKVKHKHNVRPGERSISNFSGQFQSILVATLQLKRE